MRTCPGSSLSGEERSVWASLGGVLGGEEEEVGDEADEVDDEKEEENGDALVPKRQLAALVAVAPASSRQEGDLLVPAAPCMRQRSILRAAWGKERRFPSASALRSKELKKVRKTRRKHIASV